MLKLSYFVVDRNMLKKTAGLRSCAKFKEKRSLLSVFQDLEINARLICFSNLGIWEQRKSDGKGSYLSTPKYINVSRNLFFTASFDLKPKYLYLIFKTGYFFLVQHQVHLIR